MPSLLNRSFLWHGLATKLKGIHTCSCIVCCLFLLCIYGPSLVARWYIAEWHRYAERCPLYLTSGQADHLQSLCDQCLMYYMVLSRMAINSHELAFPVRPKHHVSRLCLESCFKIFVLVLFYNTCQDVCFVCFTCNGWWKNIKTFLAQCKVLSRLGWNWPLLSDVNVPRHWLVLLSFTGFLIW